MKEFKQWHEEKDGLTKFYREVKLDFGKCDSKQHLKLSELLSLCADTAVEDYFIRGFSWQFLAENGFVILLSRSSFHINKPLCTNDEIRVKTWEEKPQGLQLFRAFEITDFSGNVCVEGITSWLIVNPETRKILRPESFTYRKAPEVSLPHHCMDCGKIQLPEDMKLLEERKVRFSEIDSNNHVNNSKYADFALDSLPEEYYLKDFTDIRINYAKEMRLGETIRLYGSFSDGKICVTGKHDNDVCFECELFF